MHGFRFARALMGVGLDEPGLVSRYLIMEKPRIMERD
jgi:hypothetical protein